MDLSSLPAVNASLNGLALVLLVAGRIWIRAGRVSAHRRAMLAAFGVSCVFLALYLTHKWSRGFENTTLNVEGAAKLLYLAVLFSHVVLWRHWFPSWPWR